MKKWTGPKGRTGRAPVDAVDAKIIAALAHRDAICQRMAAGELDLVNDLIAAQATLTLAEVERDNVIRNFFYTSPKEGK